MRIKTFQGRSLEEVLPQIREELGPDAVVVGQRQKVQGGVAGFFGTKVVEVTAADSMPSDEMLVDLEDRLMGGDADFSDADADRGAPSGDPEEDALAERFAGAMRMGRRGGLDLTDDWDPSQDAELAQEYGRVLEHAASGGFAELDVPVVAATAVATRPTEPMIPPPAVDPAADPLAQAHALAQRAHDNLQQATERVEQLAAAGTYAPPRAMPRPAGQPEQVRTFAASVQDTPMQSFEPAALPSAAHAATTVDHALRTDLAMPRSDSHEIADALNAAVDIIDLKAMAALRSAVHATRRSQQMEGGSLDSRVRSVIDQLDAELAPITGALASAGVDEDVVASLVDTAVRHRRPFGGEQDVAVLMRSMVEETLDVRTGFTSLGRTHRAAFVGAANAGKSTVVAKVAGRYAESGMRVGIVSIVAADPGVSITVDRNFTDLGIDVRYAASPAQALDAIDSFDTHDLVLVDTPGGAYLDQGTYQQVQSCLMAIGIDDVHVVMPLATSAREARSILDVFRPLGANRMVVSRVDESRYVGEILNFGFRLGLPMTFLSEGPNVRGDLRAANAREIADRIMSSETSHS